VLGGETRGQLITLRGVPSRMLRLTQHKGVSWLRSRGATRSHAA
jgi:hypothetical protein